MQARGASSQPPFNSAGNVIISVKASVRCQSLFGHVFSKHTQHTG
jgi:hypothetical protein